MTKHSQDRHLTGGPVVKFNQEPVTAVTPQPQDPWKHRNKHMTCSTCMWYVPKLSDGGTTHLGRCRRRAPTMAGYPAVFEGDWCGDHKIDETKITT